MRTEGTPGDLLRGHLLEFVLLFVSLAIALIGYGGDGAVTMTANYVVPSLLIVALGTGCISMIRSGIAVIWTPMFWVRVSLIAYCGVGSLVPFFANDDTVNLLRGFFQFFPADIAKYNLVVCSFVIVMLAVSAFIAQFFGPARSRRGGDETYAPIAPSGLEMQTIGLAFLIVGLLANYVIILPASLGLVSESPSSIANLVASTALIGYFLVGLWALRTRSKWFYAVIALVAADTFFGLILFNKSTAVFSLVILAMAMLYHKPTLVRFVALGAIIMAVYFTIAPIVTYGRSVLYASYGEITGAPIGERLAIIGSYTPGAESNQANDDIQLGWARLSYVNAGTFAINQYDSGQPGDSLRHIFIVWIPRIIYPEKPVTTDIGREFNFAGSGNAESFSSPGIPAEAYWTYGWLGVPMFAAIIGAIFAFWSIYAINVMASGAWHLLVVVLLGMRVGTRIDGFVVTDVVSAVGFAILVHLLLVGLNSLTIATRQRGAAVAR